MVETMRLKTLFYWLPKIVKDQIWNQDDVYQLMKWKFERTKKWIDAGDCCIEVSQRSYRGLLTAIELCRRILETETRDEFYKFWDAVRDDYPFEGFHPFQRRDPGIRARDAFFSHGISGIESIREIAWKALTEEDQRVRDQKRQWKRDLAEIMIKFEGDWSD